MFRIMRIVVGLALIGYGIYSHNYWFFLGIIPLISGLANKCLMNPGASDSCSSGSCGTDS
ncbi:MAG: DUF2892 domain-containing protein [Bacteroidetes bacterium]|nr:MAG: DUF2892 domain-containing protein [Bacteroidota bacterium]